MPIKLSENELYYDLNKFNLPVLTRTKKFLSKQLDSSKENYNPYIVYDGINWFICVSMLILSKSQ